MMEVKIDDIVMPGDIVKEIFPSKGKIKVMLGPGLKRDGENVIVCKAGVLKRRDPFIYYVNSYEKRYVPNRGESVVGIVTQKAGDIFKVDIGSSEQASLSYLAFEGASKRNRPDVQIGDVIYGKLLVASKDMEPELVCVDSFGKKGKLGVLSADGMLFSCSLSLVRKILNPTCPLLHLLAKEHKYELAIGMNGKIWLKAGPSVDETIAVANAILAAEFTSTNEMPELCSKIAQIIFKTR
ncbi:exosome complex component RRP40 [Leptopilina heterotoma]|uniref:exosome complex component RRP40 n=1 Tax=Leptopilina heterotoma TaxID=63436 RepID=UPI001CAA2582|nr:exosome complex component RRP40 [Leptopilina heterotoma]